MMLTPVGGLTWSVRSPSGKSKIIFENVTLCYILLDCLARRDYLKSEPLDPGSATDLIRGIQRDGIGLSKHARIRMKERGFTLSELLLVLSNGTVTEPPVFDEVFENYKYRISGPTLDDDIATAIVVILTKSSILVLTVFGDGE